MGGTTDTWATVSGLSAVQGHHRELNANEIFANEKKGFKAFDMFYCDYISSVTDTYQILFNGGVYKIQNVNDPHGMHLFLQIDTLKNS
jgi:fructose-1,6-bisphosphatase